MVLSVSYGDSGEEASRGVDGEEGSMEERVSTAAGKRARRMRRTVLYRC